MGVDLANINNNNNVFFKHPHILIDLILIQFKKRKLQNNILK